MKGLPLLSSILSVSLAVIAPNALAHVGHGDEFQAEGGIDRVEVNPQNDPLLGIQASPIEAITDDGSAVMIPVSALVDDNGQQLVFVLYENFYEPVPVITGATAGDMIEVVEGLSIGEQLVTQGSLSLYAESRKTATAEETDATASDVPAEEPSTPMAETSEPGVSETEASSTEAGEASESIADATGEPTGGKISLIVAISAGIALTAGAVFAVGRSKKGDA
jgi:cation efflux system membrane fusion protein